MLCLIYTSRLFTYSSCFSDTRCSDSSLKSLQHLMSLRSNAMYANYQGAINFALEFIQDCHCSILDSHVLFDGLLSHLFPRGSSLLQLRRKVLDDLPAEAVPEHKQFLDSGCPEASSKPTAPPGDFE